MTDKRFTFKISEVEVAEEFRNRAICENKTQTQLLKEMLDRDFDFEQTVKTNNRIEHDKSDSFNSICSNYSKKLNKKD
jgi:hypothetical protein